MNLFFIHHQIKNFKEKLGEHTTVPIPNHEHNTNQGSEFLDDAIRMNDQPLIYTEEIGIPGNPGQKLMP
ncbi:MAG: hypothetical protein SFU87_19875 [Chitinophagaceae bacterium]|nr:hypothetical protein [Chitinophagaceae bacterium]